MRFLFVHQNFPGQFLHLVRHIAAMRRHEVLFLSEPNQNRIGGVRVVPYRRPPSAAIETHLVARDLDAAARRAETVATAAATLKRLGFTPDIIIGHHGWGELLSLPDVWPGVPLLGYCEFYYGLHGTDVGFDPEFPTPVADYPRIRAKNAVNLLALQLGGLGQTPTEWQHSTYPDWARERIALLAEGADLTRCKPDAKMRRAPLKIGDTMIGPREKLVTYVSRDLEPYRGVHSMMRALPHLLGARADLRVVMVGGNGVSYGAPPPKGTWKETMLAELNGRVDLSRVLFPGRLEYATYLQLLQRSDAHVYLSYPFVASWSLREALATGCAVIGSDTPPVREFVRDGENGRLVSFFDSKGLADSVLEVIEDRTLARRIRTGARAYAERKLDLRETLTGYEALIRRLTGASEL